MITIKELSEDLQVSKTTINNRIDQLGLRDQLVRSGNKNFVPASVADKIRVSFAPANKSAYKEHNEGTATSDPTMIDLLRDQLAIKDRQIESLMHQLEQLQNQNTSLLQAIQQGNYLLAESLGVAKSDPIKADSETTSDPIVREDPPKKRSFFKRFFR